jgi:hypothetical protein
MPNERGTLKLYGLIHLHKFDREQWPIETARHLRRFADLIETKGLHCPGRIVDEEIVNEHGRGILEYDEG